MIPGNFLEINATILNITVKARSHDIDPKDLHIV